MRDLVRLLGEQTPIPPVHANRDLMSAIKREGTARLLYNNASRARVAGMSVRKTTQWALLETDVICHDDLPFRVSHAGSASIRHSRTRSR